jgi:outer membrane lipoprotein SlyB
MRILIFFTSTIYIISLSACAPDFSKSKYTSGLTQTIKIEGEVLSVKTIRNQNKSKTNIKGVLAGGAIGGALAFNSGKSIIVTLGGTIVGAVTGNITETLLTISKGYEYVIKIDTSQIKYNFYEVNSNVQEILYKAKERGLITIIQKTDLKIIEGQKVDVIFTNNSIKIISVSSLKNHNHNKI